MRSAGKPGRHLVLFLCELIICTKDTRKLYRHLVLFYGSCPRGVAMTNRDVQTPTKEQQINDVRTSSRWRFQTFMSSTWILLIAFAFTVMADPISSVAYAIEAALHALNGNLALLWPTMALVIAIIAVITINYHQLIGHFPEGGGAAAAAGAALGEGWAFLPIRALVVDFVLTIS